MAWQIEQLTSKSGHPTITVNGYFLHSKYDPKKEAKRWAEQHFTPNHLHIMFGFGLGYFARELYAKVCEHERLLIIEPIPELFKLSCQFDMNNVLFENPNVQFCIGSDIRQIEEKVRFYIRKGFVTRICLLESPNYEKLFPELINEVYELVKKNSILEAVNINTVNVFAKDWQRNVILNLYPAMTAVSFTAMVQRLSCPVIITSGGPSLTKQLPLLKQVKNKALILCAGSTINSLLKYGIKPHAIVTIDGSEANYNHFKGLDLRDIPLMYALITHWMIPAEHKGLQVIFETSQSKQLNWVEEILNKPIGRVLGGMSVSTYTLDIARQLSSGPLCLIGQDLAYTDNLTHAEGNRRAARVNIEEVQKSKYSVYTKGYYGDQVLTDYQFIAMKHAFEEYMIYIRNIGDHRPIINATEGGVWIEGMEHRPFHQFVEEYCREDVTAEIEALFQSKKEQPDWIHFYTLILEEKKRLHQIEKLCTRAEREVAKARKSGTTKRRIENLESVDAKLNELLKSDFMSYILNPVIFQVTQGFLPNENESFSEQEQRVLDQSETLYSKLKEAVQFTDECFDELLEKVENHLVLEAEVK